MGILWLVKGITSSLIPIVKQLTEIYYLSSRIKANHQGSYVLKKAYRLQLSSIVKKDQLSNLLSAYL
jgi:hypothetical protein